MTKWEFLDPRVTMATLGYIPQWLSEDDPRPATLQLHTGYMFGGWDPFNGFEIDDAYQLHYPNDPPLAPLARTKVHDDLVLFYPHSWVAVVRPDRTFEVCRMD